MYLANNIIQEFYDNYNSIIKSSKTQLDNNCVQKALNLVKTMHTEADKCIQKCEKEIKSNNQKQMQFLDERSKLYEKMKSDKKLMSDLDVELIKITAEIEHIENDIIKNKKKVESLQSEISKREKEREYWEKVWWATCWIPFANIGTGVKTIHENDEYSIRVKQIRRNIIDDEQRINTLNANLNSINKKKSANKESSASLTNSITALNGKISFITEQINDLRAEMSICKKILEFCCYIDVTISYEKNVLKLIKDNLNTLNKIKEDLNLTQATDKYITGCICKGNSLYTGQRLDQNEYLLSENRRFIAVMQSDNNFVVYNSDKPIWSSGTYGASGRGYIEFNTDGLLSLNGTNKSWNTKRSGSFRLTMQNDGNLVAYTKYDTPVWATDTYTYSNIPSIQFKKFVK